MGPPEVSHTSSMLWSPRRSRRSSAGRGGGWHPSVDISNGSARCPPSFLGSRDTHRFPSSVRHGACRPTS
eukprot:7709705-Heterocapsa_arctica.AAC.1